ncbi:hypothetical protein [Pandoraea communis]|uniref:hypothetical protein n=1 Tax=Pandoraea communis TaxID=2508297 RepID=UPI0025A55575|nr:hypothetical protein [Pandoraea communis]MDM8356506.1 hypothetical protein [Pandoraea communis]
MTDNTPMDPIPTLDLEKDDRPEPMAGAAATNVRKPFPYLKVVGGTLGGLVGITVLAYFGLRMTASPAPSNQFDNAIPQPTMTAAPQPTPVMVSPQGQGMAPQQVVVQQMPQPQMMPGPQPQVAGGQGGVSAPLPTPQVGMTTQGGVVQQAEGLPQGATMQPGAGTPSTVAQSAQPQPTTGAAAPSHVMAVAQNPSPPMGASTSAGPSNQEVLEKLAQLSAQMEILRAKLDDKKAAPQAQAHVVAAEKPKSADATDAQPSTPKAKAPAQKHAPRQKTTGAQVKRDGATEDTSYVLTGMIGDRAFIAKKGASDVNGGASVVAGDVLEDGRQVVMVDAKQKRVWVKGKRGAEFIGGETTGND